MRDVFDKPLSTSDSAKEAASLERYVRSALRGCTSPHILCATLRNRTESCHASSKRASASSFRFSILELCQGRVLLLILNCYLVVLSSNLVSECVSEQLPYFREELNKLKDWCAGLDQEQKFTDMLLIGIGGSDLGPRAIYLALQASTLNAID